MNCSESKLQALMNATTEGIWGISLDGKIAFANSAALRMFGYISENEMVGRDSHELVHHTRANGSTYLKVDCPIYKALREGNSIFLQDEVLWRKDGSCFNADYRSTPISEDGILTGAVVTFIDTTEKLKILGELKENQEWLSTTLKYIGDAVISVNLRDTVLYLNEVAEELTGWSVAEAVGRPIAEIFQTMHLTTRLPLSNSVEDAINMGAAKRISSEAVLTKKNRDTVIIEQSLSPIWCHNKTVKGFALVFRDVSERFKVDQELSKNLLELRSEKKIHEAFLNILTHDLRNPLTSSKLSAQLILKKGNLDEPTAKLIQMIVKGISKTDMMIQDLLDANRVRSGEALPILPVACNLQEVASQVIDNLNFVYPERFVFDGNLEGSGNWDPKAFRRVLENLATNAIKYGDQAAAIKVTLKDNCDQVTLSVKNEGHPLSPEDQIKIFEPYYRTADAQKGGERGWGIGLTLTKNIVEAQRGKVTVVSQPNIGTTFTVELPKSAPDLV